MFRGGTHEGLGRAGRKNRERARFPSPLKNVCEGERAVFLEHNFSRWEKLCGPARHKPERGAERQDPKIFGGLQCLLTQ